MARRTLRIATALLLVALAGCRVDARLAVDRSADGSGTVRLTVVLDEGALSALGGFDEARDGVRLDDLRAAGWSVSAWERVGAGARISIAHRFADAAGAAALISGLAGRGGVVRDVRAIDGEGWLSRREGVGLTVDLREPGGGIGADRELRAGLRALGLDPDALEARLGERLGRSLRVTVVLRTPDGETRSASVEPGERATVTLASSQRRVGAVLALSGALLALIVAGLLVVGAGRRLRR